MKMKLDVVATGRTTATVILTQEQVDAIRGTPGRARVPLRITFGGRDFRTSVSVYRGQWMLVVNQEMRDGGLVPGATYPAEVVVDATERTVEVPTDLAEALRAADLVTVWDGLSYTRRKEYVRRLEEAKKPETRAKRLTATIDDLS